MSVDFILGGREAPSNFNGRSKQLKTPVYRLKAAAM